VAVAKADVLETGKLVGVDLKVEGQTIPLVLLKKGRSILALSGVCSHWGGPLAEGKLTDGDCVECPWHASQFSMVDGSVRAISGTCPHWGGPLAEGKLVDGGRVVECPWHGSQFRLVDGSVCQGPAAAPVNVFETRINNGNVEVRRR